MLATYFFLIVFTAIFFWITVICSFSLLSSTFNIIILDRECSHVHSHGIIMRFCFVVYIVSIIVDSAADDDSLHVVLYLVMMTMMMIDDIPELLTYNI